MKFVQISSLVLLFFMIVHFSFNQLLVLLKFKKNIFLNSSVLICLWPGLSPRNSLEVLTPEIPGERDRGNCITSLQLHPKGWATLLRCSSNMDDQEVSDGT